MQRRNERKDSKHLQRHCTTRRFYTEQLAKDSNSSYPQKRKQRRPWQLQANMRSTDLVQTICDGPVCTTCTRTTQSAATRPGGGFGPTTDVRGSPDGVYRVLEQRLSRVGVYHCTSVRLISRKLSTVSSIRRYGIL